MKKSQKTVRFKANEEFVIGLRVFIQAVEAGLNKDNVFYTQRTHGPFYTWRYDGQVGHWRAARNYPSDLQRQELCTVTWNSLPHQLQTQLRDHYVDS